MAESEEELSKRLFGYFQEGLEKASNEKTTRDITMWLNTGGPQGVRAFLVVSDQVYRIGGTEKLMEWVEEACKVLPKDDQQVIMVALLEQVLKNGLLKAAME